MGLVNSTPLRALLASRLIVLAAGLAGALVVPRRLAWWVFDPARLTDRLGQVGNVLAAPAVRWDSIHYLAIAQHGYTSASATVFYPLYPLLVRALGYVVGSDPAAGVVISLAALAAALVLLHRLTALELGRRAADVTVLLVAFAPLSLFFSAVYTESLFLALSVGSIHATRRGRWKLACGLGGLAAATRVTGVGLAIPLAILWLKERRRLDRGAVWLLAVPAGMFAYLGYLGALGYGPLSPFTQESGFHRQMAGPLSTIVAAVHAATAGVRSFAVQPAYLPTIGGPFTAGTESILLLLALAIALAALVAAFRRLPLAYGAYALAVLVVCTWSPVAGQPLKSVDRYTLTIFPLWMAVGAWVSERRLTRTVVLVSAGLLAFWSFQFATWAWVA
jgi:Mannosyltransferase (PIG-V)